MIKTYKAKTNVSINVVLPSKKNLYISFTPLSNGSSTFTTDNEEIMNAIECHYNFGKLFRLQSVDDSNKTSNTEAIETETEREKTDEDNSLEATVKKVKVSDFASAKDYLADTFGISRTAMRSMKAIMEQAAAHGIEFDGLS